MFESISYPHSLREQIEGINQVQVLTTLQPAEQDATNTFAGASSSANTSIYAKHMKRALSELCSDPKWFEDEAKLKDVNHIAGQLFGLKEDMKASRKSGVPSQTFNMGEVGEASVAEISGGEADKRTPGSKLSSYIDYILSLSNNFGPYRIFANGVPCNSSQEFEKTFTKRLSLNTVTCFVLHGCWTQKVESAPEIIESGSDTDIGEVRDVTGVSTGASNAENNTSCRDFFVDFNDRKRRKVDQDAAVCEYVDEDLESVDEAAQSVEEAAHSCPFSCLVFDHRSLHFKGETSYQKAFNASNSGNSSFYCSCGANDGTVPIPMPHDGVKSLFTWRGDNLSLIRPLIIELKGGPHDSNPTFPWTMHGHHYSVLHQSLQRAFTTTLVHGLLGNLGVFAVTSTFCWLVWFRRYWDKDNILMEEFHVFTIRPSDISMIWKVLVEQAVQDPGVIYADREDAAAILEIQSFINEKVVGFCRVVAIGSSGDHVYGITFPQVFDGSNESVGVACEKHVAIKVAARVDTFKQEVSCIESIWKYLETRESCIEQESFYPLARSCGRQLMTWTDAAKQYFNTVKRGIGVVFPDKAKFGIVPWWQKDLGPRRREILVMRCGQYKKNLSATVVSLAMRNRIWVALQRWLRIIHSAKVLHRDIRLGNVVLFDRTLRYHWKAAKGDFEAAGAAGDWQLVDFGLSAFCENMNEGVETRIRTDCGQFLEAGPTVQSAARRNMEVIVPWSVADDYEMLQVAIMKLTTC